MSSNASFRARLRQHRKAAALTEDELAARAGLTVKAVGALERGERQPRDPHTWPTVTTVGGRLWRLSTHQLPS